MKAIVAAGTISSLNTPFLLRNFLPLVSYSQRSADSFV
jgi:hypothetical protein